ncbi:MAG: cyclic nucleotide-binding domain-containing protein [Synechococcus sp.]
MFSQVSERFMHRLQWILTTGWLLTIGSLFYDPWTASLTVENHPWSPLSISSECIQLQGQCLEQSPYAIGATVFWGAVVPSGIFILLVFGHEVWRRICPLSFLSQIPRALGKQRQLKRVNEKTGKIRFEIAKVKSDSWLGRNYQYLQFAYLFIGICGRILFFNADRLVLGSWLLLTIVAAISVGYFYGGKSWCQYFCPMAPVQTVFSEPRGLLGSKAHMSESRISQSMCRTVTPEGEEQSACVACQSPCFDIDSERTYWDGLQDPQELRIRFGYLGLLTGYFVYYYLYAGSWDYYFSGIWNRDPNQLSSLMSPGLYLFGEPINIPKLFAVPIVLGAFTFAGMAFGLFITRRAEARYQSSLTKSPYLIKHRLFILTTFFAFNIFFLFAGRPLLQLTPLWFQFLFDSLIVFASTLWLWQSWDRSPPQYNRENLANRLRRKLEKLDLNIDNVLEGRALDALNADEIFVLAKVLPDFTHKQKHQVYKGVLRDALAEGYVSSASSLFVLRQMRNELSISDNEHQEVLEELGVEDPIVLNPDVQHSLENQVRLSGYQRSLERLIRVQRTQSNSSTVESSPNAAETMQSLRREYSVSFQEEEWALTDLNAEAIPKAEDLLTRLKWWLDCSKSLSAPTLQDHKVVLPIVQDAVSRKQEIIVRALLELLPALPKASEAEAVFLELNQLTPPSLKDKDLLDELSWVSSKTESVRESLPQPLSENSDIPVEPPVSEIIEHLQRLLQHPRSLVSAVSLFLLAQLDLKLAIEDAQNLATANTKLIRDTSTQLMAIQNLPLLSQFPTLEKCVYLHNSDFFNGLDSATLTTLSDQAEVRTYAQGEAITEPGDTCRELLILMEGEADIHYQNAGNSRVEQLHPGQALDELEVLGHCEFENRILAVGNSTRVLAVPVDAFDSLIELDADFARRVLDLESQRIQQLMQAK